jgi:hypothetical protein
MGSQKRTIQVCREIPWTFKMLLASAGPQVFLALEERGIVIFSLVDPPRGIF